MARQFLLTLIILAGLGACGWGKAKDDVLAGGKTTVVYATTKCTIGNADGVRCDRRTCTKDARSDCTVFSDRCKKYGHDYEGNSESGACVRREEIG